MAFVTTLKKEPHNNLDCERRVTQNLECIGWSG